MLDLHRLRVVARFELYEALRSKLALIAIGGYTLGSALGSYAFIGAFRAAEEHARRMLSENLGVSESAVPADSIRQQALSLLAGSIQDTALADKIREMTPLSIFYGYTSMSLVAIFVLVVSSGAVAADVENGQARYVLFRCDRLSWVLGKLLGHAALLGAGLLLGAAAASLVGLAADPHFDAAAPAWMLRASLGTWLYGCSYLAIFFGISQTRRSARAARALSLLTLVAFAVAHALVSSDLVNARVPGAHYLALVFPAEHQLALWSPSFGKYLGGVLALACIGSAAMAAGYRWFSRRDA